MQQDLLNDRYRGESFQVIGVSIDDMLEYLVGFKRSVGNGVNNGPGITFPWLACNTWIHIDHYKVVQETWKQTDAYPLTRYQILALIDRDGTIRRLEWGGDSVSQKIDYFGAFDEVGALLEAAKAER